MDQAPATAAVAVDYDDHPNTTGDREVAAKALERWAAKHGLESPPRNAEEDRLRRSFCEAANGS